MDPAFAQEMIAAGPSPRGLLVLEVGPGLGAITGALLEAGAKVCAVELDGRRVRHLREQYAEGIASGAFHLIEGDALKKSPTFTEPWRVCANPPFQITAPLLRSWLLQPHGPGRIDLILQTQAAEKICGAPGSHTRTSVLAHLWGRPFIERRLPRDATLPPSRVDLCHLVVDRGQPPADLALVDRLMAIGFVGPHTLKDALRKVATPPILRRQGQQFGFSATDHPRTLKPEAWLSLAEFLRGIGKLS